MAGFFYAASCRERVIKPITSTSINISR